MLKFDENELQFTLTQIIDSDDIDDIKRRVNVLFEKLKTKNKKKAQLSPTVSIGGSGFLIFLTR